MSPGTNGEPAIPELPGVTHRRVDLAGTRLHVAEAGEGPPLVLLHGWPQHWWCWRRLIAPLAQRARVLAVDLRGFGWSDAPPGDYAKRTFAQDVLQLLDTEGIQRARVMGHDWGGIAAFLLALEAPERVERLIALDVPPPWTVPIHPKLVHAALPVVMSYQLLLATPVLGARALMRGNGLVRTLIRAASARGASWTPQELDTYASVLREPARARASSACYRTFLTRELPAMLRAGDRSGELAVQSLLVMGATSPIHQMTEPRASHNLRVEVVPGAGHFLPEEAPEEVLALGEGFLW